MANRKIRHNPSQKSTQQVSISSHKGPIPPPEIIERYEKVIPGAADRILSLAEKETAHRHELEDYSVKHHIIPESIDFDRSR